MIFETIRAIIAEQFGVSADEITVKDDDGDCRCGGGGVGEGVQAEQLLQHTVDEAGDEAGCRAVAVGEEDDGEHGCECDRAAVGKVDDLTQAEHRCERDHDAAFGQPFDFGVHKTPPLKKDLPHERNPCGKQFSSSASYDGIIRIRL